MKHNIQVLLSSSITLCCLIISSSTKAQIVPDGTLPNNSSVTTQANISNITGGTRAGSNLFHSFSEFSILTNGVAHFNNALDIQNIISRVTGGSVSNIDGLIRANGTANLFLINPNGIIFGRNASLSIGGSFLGSTASSLNFADGTKFSAAAPQTTSLLTISVPIGLGFGRNPDPIRVQGTGHNLIASSFGTSPIIGSGSSAMGLRVQSGKTLALVGGDVVLEGGILTAPGGQIELGSVDNGAISLNSTTSGWTLGYQDVSTFKDINLSQRALADTSGVGSGSIHVQGSHVKLTDGSVFLISNQGFQPRGGLSVNAAESLELNGTSPDGMIRTGFLTETVGDGNAAEIGISTKRLNVQEGAGIATAAYSAGKGGNIAVNALESVQVSGSSPVAPQVFSDVAAVNFGFGDGGNLTISTKNLTLQGRGSIATATFGIGRGGNLTVSTSKLTQLSGASPLAPLFNNTNIITSTYSSGSGGDFTLSARVSARSNKSTWLSIILRIIAIKLRIKLHYWD